MKAACVINSESDSYLLLENLISTDLMHACACAERERESERVSSLILTFRQLRRLTLSDERETERERKTEREKERVL